MEDFLQDILPDSYEYRLDKLEKIDDSKKWFSVIVRLQCSSEADVMNWVSEFERISGCDWRNMNVNKSGKRYLFSRSFHCHSGGRSVAKSTSKSCVNKKTGCLSRMNLTVKKTTVDTKKKDKFVRDGFPTMIELNWCHNHRLTTCDALALRRMSPSTQDSFWDYFSSGMSIRGSREFHISRLELQSDFKEEMLSDGSLCPSYSQIHRLHRKWTLTNMGGRKQADILHVLDEKIHLYRAKGYLIDYVKDPFAIAVITPLMQRVHGLRSSSEICFMDSSSSCDDESHVLTFILTATSIGALPLGFLITNGQSEASYVSALLLFKNLLGTRAFYGQEKPSIFMTDDSAAEKAALRELWPNVEQYLCQFHVLQAMWRWLWNANNRVGQDDRKPLMEMFRKVMYSTTPIDQENAYDTLVKSPVAIRNPEFRCHVDLVWQRKEQWTMLARLNNHSFRGHHTNNFSESAVRIYKDVVLSRCKAYNAVALVEFTCNTLEAHYANRLRDFAYCRVRKQHHLLRRLLAKADYIKAEQIIDRGNGVYLVPSEVGDDGHYFVDTTIGICACVAGATGKFCKHQAAVMHHFDIEFPNSPAVTPSDRRLAAEIALGMDRVPPPEFFLPLRFDQDCQGFTSSNVSASDTAPSPEEPMEISPSEDNVALDDQSTASSNGDDNEQRGQELCQKLEFLVKSRLASSKNDPDFLSSLEMFIKRAERTTTISALSSLFASCNKVAQLRIRSGRNIRVQPTSVSRRPAGITRGAKRLPSGRKSGVLKRSAKRPHSLSQNVKLNRPNAVF